jgi:hypothetical protein
VPLEPFQHLLDCCSPAQDVCPATVGRSIIAP